MRQNYYLLYFFKKDFIYLFMRNTHTHTQRETETEKERDRDTGRGRSRLHAGSPMWDLIPKPGSRPELKADAQPLSHPGGPGRLFLKPARSMARRTACCLIAYLYFAWWELTVIFLQFNLYYLPPGRQTGAGGALP